MPLASIAIGEPGVIALTPIVIVSIAWQTVVVSFASLLVWFWLLTRYLNTHLAVFTFISPLVGVAAGAIVLGEPLTRTFLAGALLVAMGITLENWRSKQ